MRWQKQDTNCQLDRMVGTGRWLKAAGAVHDMLAFYRGAWAQQLQIDHDIPLSGCIVCGTIGLQVLANLRVTSPEENSAKGQRCLTCWRATA